MKLTIRSKDGTHAVDCEVGERVLYAGLRNGLMLPYECGTGTCGTCKGRLVGGEIREMWPQAPGRAYLKPERGEFLMCQAAVGSPCEVVVPARLPPARADAIAPLYNRGIMRNVKALTRDVISFEIDLQRPMDFHAGQFAVLQVAPVEGFRAYSMVNYERGARRLEFVVKRKPAGKFSDWLCTNSVESTAVELFGPLGKAIFSIEEEKNILCIAGGSGIAGMMSILSCAAKARHFDRHRGFVFFGVRTMKDVFFLDDLSGLVSKFPGKLEVTVAVSDEAAPPHERTSHPALAYATGMVHAVAAEKMAGRYDATVAFVAGPPPMVDGALRALILGARLPAIDIRYDKFT
jgi:toluene monooxygenase electron transfer component